jgi:hypothetical protein
VSGRRKAEGRRQKAEGGRQKTEGSSQTVREGFEPKTKDQRPETDTTDH